MIIIKLIHKCLNCGGSGWYNAPRQWGCFRCGGLQYPSKRGSGIDPISSALCINENILNTWLPVNQVVPRVMEYTSWSRDYVAKYLNWMFKQGLIIIQDDKAISNIEYDSLNEYI